LSHPFGDLLTQYRARKHGLSQARLAEAVGYDPSLISKMCKGGKELTGPSGRDRVVQIISALHDLGVLSMLEEANALLAAADMPPLYDGLPVEAKLIGLLRKSDVPRNTSHVAQGLPVKRTNLPAQLTSFVGREQEVFDLTERVKPSRLLTLTGSGGVGKSRLALEVAGRLLDTFADGVWLVELAPLSDPALVPQSIANVFRLPEQPGRTHLDALLAYLETKHLLLILDNCEHLVDACASLAESLLQRCPELHVLATSRETLHVAGELVYRVPSLTVPNAATVFDELLDFESVRLFRERAITSESAFEWSAANALAVAQICDQLDGIPLAIELAAARTSVLSAEQIAGRLTNRLGLLVSGSRTALMRHQTLRAAIAWSYDLLTQPERELLVRVSVFANGFAAEAAEFVSDCPEALTLLSHLVDKSLVIAEVKSGTMRYRLLEAIRQFALERLLEMGLDDAARDRHLDYFLELAEAAEVWMRGEKLQNWSARLEQDLDNIRVALNRSFEARRFEVGLRLVGALWLFWCVQDRPRLGLDWVDKLLEAGADSPILAPVRAKVLYGAALMAWRAEEWHRMATFARESLLLSKESRDSVGVALSQICLALFTTWDLNYRQAHNMYQESLRLLHAEHHVWGLGLVTLRLGELLNAQGEFEQAEALLHDSLALFEKLDWWFFFDALYQMVRTALAQGDLAKAKTLAQQKLALGRENGKISLICGALVELGHTALLEGDYHQATASMEESIALYRQAGYIEPMMTRTWITHALTDLGLIALLQDDYTTATWRFKQASAFYRELGNETDLGHVQVCLGYVALAQGDQPAAHKCLLEGLRLSYAAGHTGSVVIGLAAASRLAYMQGNMRRATRLSGFAANYSGIQ